jgi:hypothetical protein
MGIRALLCHAISQSAKDFYLHHGFIESPIEPMTVMLSLAKGPFPKRGGIVTNELIDKLREDDAY